MIPTYITLDQRPRQYVGPRATNAPIMAAQAEQAAMSGYIPAVQTHPVAALGQCCASCPPGVSCSRGLGATIRGNLGALAIVGFAAAVAWIVMRGGKRQNPRRYRRNQVARPRSAPRRKWIKGAIKHPGALTATVRRRYGDAGFTRSQRTGRRVIKSSVLSELAREPGKTGKRARLAITMRGFQ